MSTNGIGRDPDGGSERPRPKPEASREVRPSEDELAQGVELEAGAVWRIVIHRKRPWRFSM